MSSGKINNLPYWFRHKIYEESPEREFDFSRAIIPFSKINKSSKPADIYSGTEKIPFKERDPEFKMILRQEFSNILKI
ncbi:MAG: hypothetical protein ACXADU_01025 [Promethearchaeota archaeon]|jgi:hypothetical protein